MPVELTITGIAAGGDAVARDDDGKVAFVTGALPGERVLADVTEERHDFNRAVAVEILDAAPSRVSPPCPHVARGCGGCGWQHIELSAQRDLKHQIVTDALRRIAKLDAPDVRHGPHLPPDGFRTTIRLANGTGFRHARSHDIVDVDSCLVAHPLLQDLIGKVEMHGATEVTLRCGARTGDLLAIGDGPISAPHDVRIGPKAWLTEEVAGRTWHISAKSFFQARPDGADALVALVRRAAEGAPDGAMVDAYGGVGLFGGTVGANRKVTLVEWSQSSCRDARINLPKAKVIASDVAKWRPSPAALVVADPPRAGLAKHGVKALAATKAKVLVLVSCDPASLARDARLLAEAGYEHDASTIVDLFPHTPHIEAVTRFIRR
jgi:23S rRNA (uracil1939-C5)-methyltransferase